MVGHYERRLEIDKQHIRDRVAAVGHQVKVAVEQSVQALISGDSAKSYAIILGDLPINREIRAIDARCHAFVARHLPSAGHLRFVSSTMRMTVAIERVGDYAVTIGREAVQLAEPPPPKVASQMGELALVACEMFDDALRAFAESDEDLARETKPVAGSVHRSYDRMFRELVALESSRSLKDLFAMLAVYNRIERVSDQAKNLCEETLFELVGETKPPKVYRVLFIDEDNSIVGPLCTAIARKSFRNSGSFKTAALNASSSVSPQLESIAGKLGLDVSESQPASLPTASEFASEIRELMVTLRGDDAD